MTTYRQIQSLENTLSVEPRTTWAHYRSTTKAERIDYLRWLRKQAPNHAATFFAESVRRGGGK